ncbi:MAG: DNA-directed RNA polymerase, partial [Bilophila sp.]
MVLPYGGTESSCREYTEVWLKGKIQAGKLHLPEGQKVYGMSVYLAKHIWDAIGSTVIAARDAMGFLQSMAGVVNRVNKPIQWTTPCGLPVLQEYKETKDKRIKTRIGDALVFFSISETLDKINISKQRSA